MSDRRLGISVGGDVSLDPNISIAIVLTGIWLLITAAFQIGYFSILGIEFISMVGPSDWLFCFGLTAPSLLLLVPAASVFRSHAEEEQAEGRWFSSRLYRSSHWLASSFSAALVVGVAVVCMMFAGIGQLYFLVQIALLLAVSVLTLSSYVELERIVHYHGRLHLRDCRTFLVNLSVVAFLSGGLWAHHFARRECKIFSLDGRVTQGIYLRSVSDGHFMRANGRVVFLPRDKIIELSCPDSMQSLRFDNRQ